MNNRIIRASELAEMLGISKPTLWRMEKRGELPPKIRISKRVVGWRESDISSWLNSREIQPSTKEELTDE